ncbi:hypothetical protein OESDEN_12370 [Oesophagostomum dentatum]|uniref:Spermine/spermidine synthase n=1 Tax=Oesophagostomum dentatum TaxID=61180 RepID=A0A0B1SRA5_OESDE|nr:hypothetical protein OESDEN_12370 [Oesophagostomum dentatum]
MQSPRCLPVIPSITIIVLAFFIAHIITGSQDEGTLNHVFAFFQKHSSKQLQVGSIRSGETSSGVQKTENLIKKKLLSKPDRQIDELCSELDQTCFLIIDKVQTFGNGLLVYRRLRRKGSQGVLTLSETRLQPPSRGLLVAKLAAFDSFYFSKRIFPPYVTALTWKNFNTKTWKVRKDTVRLIYARTLIAGAFMSGGLEFNTKRKQDVLIIGLGGGVLNNYLTTMENQTLNVTVVDIDPVMKKIAEKWFGFKESPLHRIIIDDGVRYIHDAARRGEKYDVIIIDVCYNVILPLMGPISEFLEDDLIASLRKITADTGAVIVNTVTSKNTRKAADKVLFPYSLHFPSCYFILHSDSEKMLFCSAKDNNSYLNNRDELYNRFVAVDRALGFQLLSEDQCNSYPLA